MTGTRRSLQALLLGFCDGDIPAIEVDGICVDSRKVQHGDLFCAYPGEHADGRRFIAEARARGAAAIAYEPGGFRWSGSGVPGIPVRSLRTRAGHIASRYYDKPSTRLSVTGVTGTNGKTSCVHLLAQAFAALGERCGVIGTLGSGFIEDLATIGNTTPDPVTLQRELSQFVRAGAGQVCMEVSSHALAQGRVEGVDFNTAVFTNLTHDHLDYHGDLETYGAAKARLFDRPGLDLAVLNADDEFVTSLQKTTRAREVWTFGDRSDADVRAESVLPQESGLKLRAMSKHGALDLQSSLVGRVNVSNLLAVVTVLLARGYSAEKIVTAVADLRPVPGRMELFHGGPRLAQIVVDYAHTPDALEQVLQSVREHCRGHVWCVFGCGGNRDRGKRPVMGKIAQRLADHIVLTDDNPRFEDARVIASEIIGGMPRRPIVIHDRARAIDWAINLARPEDWVVIAGKGHETTQQVGEQFSPLSDRSLVSEFLGQAA